MKDYFVGYSPVRDNNTKQRIVRKEYLGKFKGKRKLKNIDNNDNKLKRKQVGYINPDNVLYKQEYKYH